MAIDLETSVGDLAIAHPACIPVLESLGIDYCCGGKRSLDAASRAAGHDPADVVTALVEADTRAGAVAGNPAPHPGATTLRALIADIVGTHHAYLRRELPRLSGLVAKVQQAHGHRHRELHAVAHRFGELRAELESHLAKEEQILFPMIEEMEITRDLAGAHCGTVANPIGVMEHEHDAAGEVLRSLRHWTDDYTPPADACPTYRALLAGLADLERDLHEHIHKENNLLHPRALALESSLLAAGSRS